jgi:hypothetical protein
VCVLINILYIYMCFMSILRYAKLDVFNNYSKSLR